MHYVPAIDVIYTHTEGEPTCIVHSGIQYPLGLDINGKRQFLQDNHDGLRRGLMREPRGHHHMFGVFLTPPSNNEADAGILWIDGQRFVEMCGHGTIALGMAMVSQGLIQRTGNETLIRFETPVGLVSAIVESDGDLIKATRFTNVPAFVLEHDIPIDVPDVGKLTADIVFGGNFFAIVKWPSNARPINADNGSYFADMGIKIRELVKEKVKIRHPEYPSMSELNFVTFWHEPSQENSLYRNVHVFSDGKLDRSPGGTGTSAMMAMFRHRNQLDVGQVIRSEGLLGSGQFEGWIDGETQVGDLTAVIPNVRGKANLTGFARWMFDPEDSLAEGFIIS